MADQHPDNSEFEPLTRVQVLIAMGVTAVLLLLVAKLWIRFGTIPQLAMHWSITAILAGIGVGIGITMASSLIYAIWPLYRRSADYYLQLVLQPLVWPDLVWLGLLPGLSEELLFRGVMLPAFGLNGEGLVISSLCFGVLHMSNLKQWPYVVWASLIGAVLGGSAIASGNLVIPIVAHIATNLISSSLWKWSNRQQPVG